MDWTPGPIRTERQAAVTNSSPLPLVLGVTLKVKTRRTEKHLTPLSLGSRHHALEKMKTLLLSLGPSSGSGKEHR